MTDDVPHGASSVEELSFGKTVERLIAAGREFAEAEMSLAKTRGALLGQSAQWIAILGVIAFVTAFGMIVTLMVGAVLVLAPLWGLGLALLTVTGVALLAIIICGLGIRSQITRLKEIVR